LGCGSNQNEEKKKLGSAKKIGRKTKKKRVGLNKGKLGQKLGTGLRKKMGEGGQD